MAKRSSAIALTVFLVSAMCCEGQVAPKGDVAGVRRAIDSLRAAVNAGDAMAFLRLTTDDLEVFPPSAEPLKGEAARDLFRGLFAESSPSLEPFTNEELVVSGDWAMQRYSFRLTLRPKAGGATTAEAGSGLHVWRRGGGSQWRLSKDIWTVPSASAGK